MKPKIFSTTWAKDGERLGALRYEVFVIEQQVPEELEWDVHDAGAVHFACEDGTGEKIIATARLVREGHVAVIGRLCVAKPYRQQKLATAMMQEALAYCRAHNLRQIELHAQLYLQPFYESLGFVARGQVYLEAGIEHITMLLSLPRLSAT